jgi:hypothetical protein
MQSNNSIKEIKKWAEKYVTDEPGEVRLGKKQVNKYEQVHLAVAYKGDIKDYLENARMEIAKKARKNRCFYVVDGDNCQNIPEEGTEIFAGTGLRPKSRKSLEGKLSPEDFAKLRLSHIDKTEFLRRIGDNPKNYDLIDIQVAHQGNPEIQEDYLQDTELKLAEKAIKKSCSYVTNIDYTFHNPEKKSVSISATGLVKRN